MGEPSSLLQGNPMKTASVSTVIASSLLLLGLSAGVHAALCDKTFYWQHGSYYVLTGPTTASMTTQSAQGVGKDLKGVEIIHTDTEYDLVTRFEGASACSTWKKTNIDMISRRKGSTEFKPTTSSTNYVKLHATPYPFATGVDFEYWFGFASSLKGDTALIFEAIGKLKSAKNPHVWYGTAIMTRNLKDAVLGTPKGTRTHFFASVTSHPDSAALLKGLLEAWKDEKNNDTQTVSFKAQMLKVTYDTVPAIANVRPAKPKAGGFFASQSAGQVLIRPADGKVAPSEALGIYNMLGHRVATLHPTGYMYLWNGRTAAGAQASTGVYFVQSGSRILGKFLYRN
jgi:hypothetical protein